MSKKIIGLLIAAILLIILAVWAVFDSQKEDRALNKMALGSTVDFLPTDEGLAKGELAPDFELTTLKGEKLRLSDYQGKAVILNFWATWCPVCELERERIDELAAEMEKKYFLKQQLRLKKGCISFAMMARASLRLTEADK